MFIFDNCHVHHLVSSPETSTILYKLLRLCLTFLQHKALRSLCFYLFKLLFDPAFSFYFCVCILISGISFFSHLFCSLALPYTVHSLTLFYSVSTLISFLHLQLVFSKINFLLFFFPLCASFAAGVLPVPCVLAVRLLCTWPCFCSFHPLLTISQLLTNSPPIKA